MESLNSSQQTQQVTGLNEQTTLVSQQEAIATNSAQTKTHHKKSASSSTSHMFPKVTIGVLLGTGAIASGMYAYRSWQFAQKYQVTDNAFITANIQPVTSRISGIVTEIAANDNQMVSPGSVLVKLDSRDYEVSLSQAKASLELAKQQASQVRENMKAVAMNTIKIPEPVATKPAKKGAQAVNSTNKKQQVKQPERIQKVSQLTPANPQKEIEEQKYKTALAAIAQKEAELKKAQLELSYTKITALLPGKVGNKNVQIGQQVQPGQTLITVVQPNPWIVANFKETQLEKIQPGQKVDIKMTAFPSHKFRGTVESMSPTSFGRFTPLPQESNTPLSTKNLDEQRIPVKIVFEPESIRGFESRLTPGMSATVTIDIKSK
ncbi:HlyD family efflux transporter periplasmic adaptor subunit [Scytonema sp. UIC 10036]|uniref:HlyD family secretion protein n=1 Tax=Scytonema sp. UIC 10036 TaxID=2304196 RepID=UPI0012DA3190|nr:HlyD family secretion protein [Scytonema sp. UIC 10036]MUG94269.1 HlyD family efflux transporter periplasmic adaptor subunit [Scytonema sp. UIC 10036]